MIYLALLGLVVAWTVMLLFGGLEFDRGLLIFAMPATIRGWPPRRAG